MNRRSLIRALLAAAALTACGAPPLDDDAARAALTGIRFLADRDGADFSRAVAPRAFAFPEDHGSHPDYRTEWWYFTGNLAATTGRHYGFELTFFRVALSGAAEARESRWATRHLWMAHFALTDTAAARFVAYERLSRGALGLAGATHEPFHVWVEDWSAGGELTDGAGSVHLSAAADEAAIELDLSGFERIVLQGDRGLDPKGPEPGNASYYYSAPRLAVTGTVRVRSDAPVAVTGLAWMDREWGTSALSPGIEGWDWFALQLDDGRDLMFYRLRARDGSPSPWSGGSVTDPAGRTRRLAAEDVDLEPIETWQSPASGATYPVVWDLRVPGEGLELRLTPRIRDQEVRVSVRYWEGAIELEGRSRAREIGGQGYLELAGY
jgi:predicted secreted hydrolase